jgi:HAE1 family hydrophobic/amphiphilic exporter-1
MTTLTTILGLMPLAFGRTGVGDVLYFPLARTVIGGLAASTLLTLVIVPCLYTLIEDSVGMVARVWRFGASGAAPARLEAAVASPRVAAPLDS